MNLLRAAILLLTTVAAFAAIIPSTNLVDWATYSGVESQPTRTTISVTRSSGVTISTLNSDIANAAQDTVVLLNDGTYTFSTGNLTLDSHVTLRGSSTNTILVLANKIIAGPELARENILISSGATRGSTSIILASTPSSASLTLGDTITITETNNTAWVHPYGYEDNGTAPLLCSYCDDPNNGTRVRGQMVRITSVSGTTVGFTPALSTDYTLQPRVEIPYGGSQLKYAGVENLTIRANPSGYGVEQRYSQNCWWSNVVFEVRADDNAAIFAQYNHRLTVRHCTFLGQTAQSSQLNFYVHNDGWLVEDNIHWKAYQAFILVGRSGHGVYAYNYITPTNGTTAHISDVTFHGAHPQFVLIEGNKGVKLHLDSIHGSASDTTVARNHWRAEVTGYTTYGWGAINVDLWVTDSALLGNVLGLPGQHTTTGLRAGFAYEKDAATGGDEDDPSMLTWNFSGYNPYATGRVAKTTAIVHGNWTYSTSGGEVVWDGGIADHDIPDSYYLASKPAFFGTLNWPPIGPDTTGYYTNYIPAEYRLLTGQEVPTSLPGASLGSGASVGIGASIR